jgi:hypothetical protein
MQLKIQKPKMKKINYKKIVAIILGAIALYFIILLATPKPQMPIEYRATIDSLTRVNADLANHQKQLDSVIDFYGSQVHKIDDEIDGVKEKTTIVKEYHHEIIEKVNHYDATEIDLFFKTRYNY